jgi:xylulokinase
MYFGIDIGSGSAKAAWQTAKGIEMIKRPYPGDMINGTVHRVKAFTEFFQEFLSELARISDKEGDPVKGIAIDTHGPSLALIDINGNPISDIYSWQDTRAAFLNDELHSLGIGTNKKELGYETKALWLYRRYIEGVGDEEGYNIEDGRELAGSKDGSHESVMGSVKLLTPKGLLVYLLTGEMVIDRATAGTVAFFNNWRKPESMRDTGAAWNTGNTGLPETIFPRIVEPWETVGETGTAFSRLAGLKDGIPVYGGGPDAWCEALGAGAVSPGEIVEGTGTSTCITAVRDRGKGMNYHVVPERDLDIETLSYTGGSLTWAARLLGGKDAILDTVDLSELSPLLFLPYLAGERSPVWDPAASGVFVGLRSAMGREEILRSVMQGVAFAVRQNLESLTLRGGHDLNEAHSIAPIRAVGGANRSESWLRQKAAIGGYSYYMMSVSDSAPLGALLLAMYGSGEGELQELALTYNRVIREIHPPPKADDRIESLYRLYTSLYEVLRPVMHEIAHISFAVPTGHKALLEHAGGTTSLAADY